MLLFQVSATPLPELNGKSLKTAVRDAIEEEDKSRNIVIHGLSEENSECIAQKFFESLGKKPRLQHFGSARVGMFSLNVLCRSYLTLVPTIRNIKLTISTKYKILI